MVSYTIIFEFKVTVGVCFVHRKQKMIDACGIDLMYEYYIRRSKYNKIVSVKT